MPIVPADSRDAVLPLAQADAAQADAAQHAHDRRQTHALWLALGLILVWGSNFSVQKAVFAVVSPAGFLCVRYTLLPLAAASLMFWRVGWHWPRVTRADGWALVRLGLAGHLFHVGLVTYGIHWSTPFSSALILACGPVFTLLILRWRGLEVLTRAQVAGVAVACVGVLVFLSDKLVGGQWQASGGDLVLLVAAALFSHYTVAAKPLIERHGAVTVMVYATLAGCAPLLLLSLPAGLRVDWATVSPAIWAGMLYAVLLSAFVGWLLWGWINAVRGVARTAPLMYLMPPVAGLVAWAVTGERYTAVKLAGAAVTLAGVALAQFAATPRRTTLREAPAPVD
jgi:drug/metabolite transporter (DMT)-like permease